MQTSGGSPPLKLNNPKLQYFQDGNMLQKVAMAYAGQPLPIKKSMYAPTPVVPGQKQSMFMNEAGMRSTNVVPQRHVS
jgi:hypothetical protein